MSEEEDDMNQEIKGEENQPSSIPSKESAKHQSVSAAPSWKWFQSFSDTYSVIDASTRQIIAEGLDKPTACLIAAAPALYEALQNLAFYAARISPPPYCDNKVHTCKWCDVCVRRVKAEARAALALVDGQQKEADVQS